MKFFAVTGNPILFSRSPEVFNSFFKQKNIEAKYIRMAANSAKEAVSFFKELGLSGMSVTAPFKTDIMPYLDYVDQMAQEIGSVNTVVDRGGILYGYNTDYYGIVDTLKDIKGKKILLLGAGGAAKAVVYSVLKKEAKVCIYNRTEEKAQDLAKRYSVKFCTQQSLQHEVEASDIIINTLPSGIKLLEDDWLKPEHTIFDAIYHRSVYKAISEAKGLRFYSGEDWLINQAIPAFKLFFNEDNVQFERPVLDKTLSDKIILTGFMGSGKSLIGQSIAQLQNSKFFCTDTIVSNKEGRSINNIFETHGEVHFRKIEQDVLEMLSTMEGKAIVASGGGMVLAEDNRRIMSENYTVVCLYADANEIMKRVNPENRPILKDNFNLEFVQDLMEKRKPLYLETADIIINTSDKDREDVIQVLVKELSIVI